MWGSGAEGQLTKSQGLLQSPSSHTSSRGWTLPSRGAGMDNSALICSQEFGLEAPGVGADRGTGWSIPSQEECWSPGRASNTQGLEITCPLVF